MCIVGMVDGEHACRRVPKQWSIYDVEEEWRVDPRTGRGSWVAVEPASVTLIPQHLQQRSLDKGYGTRGGQSSSG